MLAKRVQTTLVVLALCLCCTKAVVQFSFNRGDFAISEGGDLPSQLSIVKTGQNEMDITFQVRVIQGSARDSQDYRSNGGDTYVFTSSTSQLPIRTQLVRDRAGEPVENFMICLPDAQVLQPMGAEAIEPVCVTITIVDDDSVVVGFKNSFETVVEGRTTIVCAEVKPEGLRIDPFDQVPLMIRINPASNDVQLNTSSFVFEMSNERCVMVTVADSDNVIVRDRSYDLIIERSGQMSTVPVEIYPNTVELRVIDNDASDANFSIISTQSVYIVREGDRIDDLRVQKFGGMFLNYSVSLMVTALSGSSDTNDVTISNPLLFTPLVTIMNVGAIEIVNNSLSEGTKEFRISIGGIEAIDVPGVQTSVLGDPVNIIVYDNDFTVGFNVSNITLVEGTNDTVCVRIVELEPSDIYPARNISFQILANNATPESGNLELSDNKVLLNNENKYTGCFVVAFPDDNTECDGNRARNFIIQLAWIRPNNPDYTIYMAIDRKNVSVTITDNPQDCPTTTSSRTAAIVVPIVVILFLVLVIAIVLLVVLFNARRRIPLLNEIEKVSSSSKSQSKKNEETELNKKPEEDAGKSTKEDTSTELNKNPEEDAGKSTKEDTFTGHGRTSSEESDKGKTKDDETPKIAVVL